MAQAGREGKGREGLFALYPCTPGDRLWSAGGATCPFSPRGEKVAAAG